MSEARACYTVARQVIDAAMTEAELQARVIALAELYGWLVYHVYDSRRDNPGFPDLILAKTGRLIFAELKTETGTLRPAQRVWLKTLRGMAKLNPWLLGVYLWRPRHWEDIDRILSGQETQGGM